MLYDSGLVKRVLMYRENRGKGRTLAFECSHTLDVLFPWAFCYGKCPIYLAKYPSKKVGGWVTRKYTGCWHAHKRIFYKNDAPLNGGRQRLNRKAIKLGYKLGGHISIFKKHILVKVSMTFSVMLH